MDMRVYSQRNHAMLLLLGVLLIWASLLQCNLSQIPPHNYHCLPHAGQGVGTGAPEDTDPRETGPKYKTLDKLKVLDLLVWGGEYGNTPFHIHR